MLEAIKSFCETGAVGDAEPTIRRYTFSEGSENSLRKKLKAAVGTSTTLKRIKAMPDLYLGDHDGVLSNSTKIDYVDADHVSQIDAKNYVYCGMATSLPVNNFGMSIDDQGNLILIKGREYNLVKGLAKKYVSGFNYQITQMTDGARDIKLDHLYVNQDGLLIGDEKGSDASYRINVIIPACGTAVDGQRITVGFVRYEKEKAKDDLTFKTDDDTFSTYALADGKLYLLSVMKDDQLTDFSLMDFDIAVPLKQGYQIVSLKRAKDVLQIETRKNNKTRIFYIDPMHISNKSLVVRKISHKPPQLFATRLAGDPHEKYHAGQPFTSDRTGNFSSRYLPLVAPTVDTFRVNKKIANVSAAAGNHKEARLHIAKAIDPLISGATSSLSGMTRSIRDLVTNKRKTKGDLYKYSINFLRSRSHLLAKVTNTVHPAGGEPDLSEILANISKEIQPKEALVLSSAQRIAAFFGIAAGGTPLVKGWFAGVVFELAISHDLIISKAENGNIRFSFRHRRKTAATALIGTGQGLEPTILQSAGVNWLTVLLIEANLIMTLQRTSGEDFSFDMTPNTFQQFARQLTDSTPDAALEGLIIDEAEAKKVSGTEFVIKLEAKSELRPEAGITPNPSVFLTMPRTAVGLRLALNLLNVKMATETTLGNAENSSSSSELKVTAFNPEFDLFAEWKVMPIALKQIPDGPLLCYPLPLLEETHPLYSYRHEGVVLHEEPEPVLAPIQTADGYSLTSGIGRVQDTRMFIRIDADGKLKKGVKLKKLASRDREIRLLTDTLTDLKKTLHSQEVASQFKTCVINVVSHYEAVDGGFDFGSAFEGDMDATGEALPGPVEPDPSGEAPASDRQLAGSKSYRLKKMEFRKVSLWSQVNASAPLTILQFSNTDDVAYDQYLGEIEFLYRAGSDVAPFDAERRLAFLY